jgi:branched-chain amino acid aminotransferase
MLTVEWTAEEGWAAPEIVPYQKICLDPATCVFHYGIECFEGQKAYRAADGTVRMFRCDLNMARLNKSAARLALPMVDSEQLEALLKTFVRLEDRFIPQYVSYLRQMVRIYLLALITRDGTK